jgi:hypothetical protein
MLLIIPFGKINVANITPRRMKQDSKVLACMVPTALSPWCFVVLFVSGLNEGSKFGVIDLPANRRLSICPAIGIL